MEEASSDGLLVSTSVALKSTSSEVALSGDESTRGEGVGEETALPGGGGVAGVSEVTWRTSAGSLSASSIVSQRCLTWRPRSTAATQRARSTPRGGAPTVSDIGRSTAGGLEGAQALRSIQTHGEKTAAPPCPGYQIVMLFRDCWMLT